ncbi:MAG TPA: porin [Chitinophagaceae bacterium]
MKSIYSIFIFFVIVSNAQDTTNQSGLSWDFFIDAYYSYDFNKPSDHQRPFFLYNHNRHNEFNINLALVKFSYKNKNLRASIGLMAGTYPESNLAAEPSLFRHIYESQIGIKLFEKKDIWIDAGIFPSHIGFESVISKDGWTLTRSILAENSPYYEAGIKISYASVNKHWRISLLILNGWQRIKRPDGNNTPAFGTQITYNPSDNLLLNSSTFIGNDKPDTGRLMRYFHNFYLVNKISSALSIIFGVDAGMEQNAKGSSRMNFWYSPVFILRYQRKDKWAYALRMEYYSDKNGVIIAPVAGNGIEIKGLSLNVDRSIGKNLLWRLELKSLVNRNPFFERGTSLVKSNHSITSALVIAF